MSTRSHPPTPRYNAARMRATFFVIAILSAACSSKEQPADTHLRLGIFSDRSGALRVRVEGGVGRQLYILEERGGEARMVFGGPVLTGLDAIVLGGQAGRCYLIASTKPIQRLLDANPKERLAVVKSLRQQHEVLTTEPEQPILIGGRMRGPRWFEFVVTGIHCRTVTLR